MDICVLVLEIEAQMLRQGFDSSFRRIVRRVAGRVGDALLTARDDNRTGRVGRPCLEGRHIGVQSVNDAIQIRVQNLAPR